MTTAFKTITSVFITSLVGGCGLVQPVVGDVGDVSRVGFGLFLRDVLLVWGVTHGHLGSGAELGRLGSGQFQIAEGWIDASLLFLSLVGLLCLLPVGKLRAG